MHQELDGIIGGGDPAPRTNVIEFVTISTTGDATDFGDLTDHQEEDGWWCFFKQDQFKNGG